MKSESFVLRGNVWLDECKVGMFCNSTWHDPVSFLVYNCVDKSFAWTEMVVLNQPSMHYVGLLNEKFLF